MHVPPVNKDDLGAEGVDYCAHRCVARSRHAQMEDRSTPRVNEPLECSICRDAVKRMTSMFPRIVVVLIVHDRVRRRAYTPSHSIHDLGHRQVYMSSTCIIALAY